MNPQFQSISKSSLLKILFFLLYINSSLPFANASDSYNFIQLEVWKARLEGRFNEANRLERQLSHFLKTAKVVDNFYIQKGGNSKLGLVFENGEQGIFKSDDSSDSEVTAFELDRAIHMNLIPVTVFRWHNKIKGSLQLWLKNAPDIEYSNSHLIHSAKNINNIRVMAYLLNKPDWYYENNLLTLDGENLIFVDNQLSFFFLQRFAAEIWEDYGKLLVPSSNVVARLASVSAQDFEDIYLNNMSLPEKSEDKAVYFQVRDHLLSRRKQILQNISNRICDLRGQ